MGQIERDGKLGKKNNDAMKIGMKWNEGKRIR